MSGPDFDGFFGARPPARLGVAVSGGSDSLALLHLLADWGRAALHAVTVDHRLRPGSASEALHVARICEGLGVPHRVLEWRGWDGTGNLQDQARRNRYSLIADWARDEGLEAVALGHTADDLAETFLMRLSRAAGIDGLAAMEPVRVREGVIFLRPLLGQTRADLRAGLAARRVRWVEDPTNADEDYERVRARAALAALAPLGIDAMTVARSAVHLRDARQALARTAADWAAAQVRVAAGDVIFDRTALCRLPPDLIRRLVAGALCWVAGAGYPPRGAALSALLDALRGSPEAPGMTLHGCRAMISAMTLRITREHAAVAGLRGPTDAPWDGRWRLDGPHAAELEVRALGEAVRDCPDWRGTGLPRATLLASPAVWRDGRLVAAPVAGLGGGWTAGTGGRDEFVASLISH